MAAHLLHANHLVKVFTVTKVGTKYKNKLHELHTFRELYKRM